MMEGDVRFMALAQAGEDVVPRALPADGSPGAKANDHEEAAMPCAPLGVNAVPASSARRRVEWSGGRRIMTDGPFAETKELIAANRIVNARSRAAALPPSRRC